MLRNRGIIFLILYFSRTNWIQHFVTEYYMTYACMSHCSWLWRNWVIRQNKSSPEGCQTNAGESPQSTIDFFYPKRINKNTFDSFFLRGGIVKSHVGHVTQIAKICRFLWLRGSYEL